MLPYIKKYEHLPGVKRLYEQHFFENVQVDALEQIYWEDTITMKDQNGEIFPEYDLAPEFVWSESVPLNKEHRAA